MSCAIVHIRVPPVGPHCKQNLDRVLEAAVVVSWPELMHGAQSGLVHIEYTFSTSGGMDSLQIWLSVRRGYCLLAFSYYMSASEAHRSGIHFDNGYQSQGLAHNLGIVMQHQSAFTLHPAPGGQRVHQITEHTEVEAGAAAGSIAAALTGLSSSLTEPRARCPWSFLWVGQNANSIRIWIQHHGALTILGEFAVALIADDIRIIAASRPVEVRRDWLFDVEQISQRHFERVRIRRVARMLSPRYRCRCRGTNLASASALYFFRR